MTCEPVNWSEALRSVRGDRALLRAVVEAALEEFPRLMNDIGEAIVGGDKTRLRLAAHTLKGSLRTLGADRAFEHAYRLELMGRDGTLGDAAQALEVFQADMDRVVPVLARCLQEAQDPRRRDEEGPP